MKYIDRFKDENTDLRWYIFDDKALISVTSVLSIIVPPRLKKWFKDNKPQDIKKISEDTANYGSDLHALLEKILTKQPYAVEERFKKCLSGFQNWLIGHDVQPVEAEPVLHHDRYLYAGQTDLVVMYDGKRELWDYKSGRISTTHGWQCAAYKLCWDRLHPDQPIEGIRVIQVKDEGTKDFEYKHIDYCIDSWLHALQSFKALQFNALIKGVKYQEKDYKWTLEETKLDCFKDYYNIPQLKD